MMTVKIISMEPDGGERTHLFPSARINYRIDRLNGSLNAGDKEVPFRTFNDAVRINNPVHTVSGLSNYEVMQNMEIAWVILHDEDGGIAPLLVSAPAVCYIMSEGKTIDRFKLDFLE